MLCEQRYQLRLFLRQMIEDIRMKVDCETVGRNGTLIVAVSWLADVVIEGSCDMQQEIVCGDALTE
jgi:hypothetical protein